MNINQIDYFLTLAKTLNYSKAAKLLYISQPALSRQIIMMEDELRIKLFNRGKKLSLTEAGAILEKEFRTMLDQYYSAIIRARNASKGMSSILKVGALDGLAVDDLLEPTLNIINAEYPEIDVALFTFGYEELVSRLYDGSMDIIFSRRFDVEPRDGIEYVVVEQTEDFLIVADIPRYDYIQPPLSLDAISSETLVFIMETEYDMSKKTILDLFSSTAQTPKLKGVSTYHALMQWVKSGLCITVADQRSILPIKGIRAIPMEQFRDPSLVLAWSKNNDNRHRELFESLVLKSHTNPPGKFLKFVTTRWKGMQDFNVEGDYPSLDQIE
jgi:DNA-binding transcriptional LysR family regulator